MADAIVSDWLAEYNSLEPQEIRTFAALHAENHELSTAIQTILNDKTKHSELLHPICIQLYNFYRSNENELKLFTLQFIPNLIYLYLNAVAIGEKQNLRCVETLILCAYNIEVCSDKGMLKSVSYRMPVLAQTSIYHEEKNLHPSDLKRWEENSNKEISWKIMKPVYKITAQNRLTVMAALMFIFNQQLSLIQKSSLYHLCKISSKLVTQGFVKHGHSYRASYGNDPSNQSATSTPNSSSVIKQNPRIPMSQQFLVELLHAIYFAMFNEIASVAIQAVDDIHNRACYELYSDVILVTNAIKNSLQANPSGQPSDGPMGISVALTPATNVVTMSKSMITNASFRTKKLPDDIPIQIDASASHAHTHAGGNSQQNQLLGSINEEQESDANAAKVQSGKSGKDGTTKSHKAPFGGLKKLIDREKDKDKDKDKEKEKEKEKKESVLKVGLNETKENVKKLMGKDKQSSKASLHTNIEVDSQLHSSNNGDLKISTNSPNAIIKRASEISNDGGVDLNEKPLLDVLHMGKIDSAVSNGSHGIISPFDTYNDDSDSDGAFVDPPHQQLSSSSSASVNILMENNANNNKMMGNVQVSQV
ncbi:CLUMA_CG009632, isoform A [Clunio marinus]|uniref:CLUMA_CG009632, isoform A n=1 Tax=Clunio marinus TaxID=568069 RepID=A0A1J1I9F5_9DIPT|nr:CLUMA_CG009632, isoform A [Clunio marinus]